MIHLQLLVLVGQLIQGSEVQLAPPRSLPRLRHVRNVVQLAKLRKFLEAKDLVRGDGRAEGIVLQFQGQRNHPLQVLKLLVELCGAEVELVGGEVQLLERLSLSHRSERATDLVVVQKKDLQLWEQAQTLRHVLQPVVAQVQLPQHRQTRHEAGQQVLSHLQHLQRSEDQDALGELLQARAGARDAIQLLQGVLTDIEALEEGEVHGLLQKAVQRLQIEHLAPEGEMFKAAPPPCSAEIGVQHAMSDVRDR
mmetsp:Transcript_105606/g.251743  ORF Transcript_105606/g.251743 Transcript_105606/m.251743 type:complete len:251 (-) Transcript_105606:135-887(-)